MPLKAFVLMPFTPALDSVYEHLIVPPLEDVGFSVTRADLSINQQQILKDIINSLAEADLVVADVSGLNGNVMYELGLAHAMGLRTIMITDDIEELPFDLRSYRANEYSTHFSEAPRLISRLREIAQGVVDGTAEFSNPVQDFAPEFIGRSEKVSQSPRRPDAGDGSAPQDPEPAEPEPGLLDFAIELSEASEELTTISKRIETATQDFGAEISKRSEQITRTSRNLGPKAAPLLRRLMRETAADFDVFSEELERQNPLLAGQLDKIGRSANGLARARSASTSEERARIEEEISSLSRAESSFTAAYEAVEYFGEILRGIPPLERELNRATARAVAAVGETASAIDMGRSEFARARGILEERRGVPLEIAG